MRFKCDQTQDWDKSCLRQTQTADWQGVSGKLRPGKLRPGKLRPCFFFPGEIIKFQLSLPLSGKMNEMNALTPTNNNLVVFFKRNYFRLPQGGVFTVH